MGRSTPDIHDEVLVNIAHMESDPKKDLEMWIDHNYIRPFIHSFTMSSITMTVIRNGKEVGEQMNYLL
jgi:hypothetical protein